MALGRAGLRIEAVEAINRQLGKLRVIVATCLCLLRHVLSQTCAVSSNPTFTLLIHGSPLQRRVCRWRRVTGRGLCICRTFLTFPVQT